MSIPDDLMARLHEANDQFHQAKLRLDGVGEMNAEERGEIGAELRAAEREVEAVNEQISRLLSQGTPPSPGDSAAAGPRGQ